MAELHLTARGGRCRAAAALLAVLAAVPLAGCGGDGGRVAAPGARDVGPGVVATVGDRPIPAGRVRELLPDQDGPPVLLPGRVAPDPRPVALERAVRDELLALAAEARAWQARHRDRFEQVDEARVAWVHVAGNGAARRLLDAAEGRDRAGFLALARAGGVLGSGGATLAADGSGADTTVARVAFARRRAGAVGMARGDDGTWWLVRVDAVRLRAPSWDDRFAIRVRTALAWEREQAHLDRLADGLRSRWPVRVFPDRLGLVAPAPVGSA